MRTTGLHNPTILEKIASSEFVFNSFPPPILLYFFLLCLILRSLFTFSLTLPSHYRPLYQP